MSEYLLVYSKQESFHKPDKVTVKKVDRVYMGLNIYGSKWHTSVDHLIECNSDRRMHAFVTK